MISPLNAIALGADTLNGDENMIGDISGIGGRPNDERAFVHKKLLGGISKVAGILPIPGGQIISRVAGALAGGSRSSKQSRFMQVAATLPAHFPQRFTPTAVSAARPTIPGLPEKSLRVPTIREIGGVLGLGDGACPEGTVLSDSGKCVSPISPFGASEARGEAVMGRFGPGQIAGSRITDVATCGRGMVLGKDGICYDHLANKDRLYPRGRRPLLTGGEMRAISIAARAATRVKSNNKRLLKLGLLPKPAARSRAVAHHHHNGAT